MSNIYIILKVRSGNTTQINLFMIKQKTIFNLFIIKIYNFWYSKVRQTPEDSYNLCEVYKIFFYIYFI